MQEGRFTPSQLRTWIWEEEGYDANEQALFLDFMESCGIAVQLLRGRETKHGEPLYLAPQYLPSRLAYRERLEKRMTSWGEPTYEFPILRDRHLGAEAILALLIKIGKAFSRKAILWKYGAFIESSRKLGERSAAFLEWIQDDPKQYGGKLLVKVYGAVTEMRSALESELKRLEIVDQSHEKGSETEPSATVETIAGSRAEVTQPRLAFSVAGTDPKRPQIRACSDALHAEAKRVFGQAYEVLHYAKDEDLQTISALIDGIGKSDIILAVVGRRYLESPYCMREMQLTYGEWKKKRDNPGEEDPTLIIYRHASGKLLPTKPLFRNPHQQLSEAQWRSYWKKACANYNRKFKGHRATELKKRIEEEPLYPWYEGIDDGILNSLAGFMKNWRCQPIPDQAPEDLEAWAREQIEKIRKRIA